MGFDMDEYGADPDEGTGEITDERPVAGVPGQPGPPRPVQVAPIPQNRPIVPNAEAIVRSMLGQNAPTSQEVQVIVQEEEPEDDYMARVVDRLDVAAHYQLLLKDTFFQTNTRAAHRVTQELRAWVKERLAELVGMNAPVKKLELPEETIKILSEMSPAEIYALKSVASKLIAGGFTGPTGPAPVPAPAPKVGPAPSAAPALVKRGAPQSAAPAQPQPTNTEQPPARRAPGRPPGSRNKVTNPNKKRFPTSKAEMSAATYMAAAEQAESTTSKNPFAGVAMALPGRAPVSQD